MDAWTAFLEARGARTAAGRTVDFGDPAAELSAAESGAVLVDLSPLSLVAAAGPDAAGFLHGQLTSDVRGLAVGAVQYAGYCSPKGRLLATLVLWRAADERFVMLVPEGLADPVRRRLAMHVLRARVSLTDETAAWARLGLGGPRAGEALGHALGLAMSDFDSASAGEVRVLGLRGGRAVVLAPAASAGQAWAALAAHARPAGYAAWEWLAIREGEAQIGPQTQDAFVPQMVNWELVGGVSFSKGCYTGQEIVARAQYLGSVKRRMRRAHVHGPRAPAVGEPVYASDAAEGPCGTVIASAPAPGGGYDLLAVVQGTDSGGGALRWPDPGGPRLEPRELPYALPAA